MTLEEALQRPNCISAIRTPAGVQVTFQVHRPPGTRSYFFPEADLVELAPELLELIAL